MIGNLAAAAFWALFVLTLYRATRPVPPPVSDRYPRVLR